jgi:hypothetical protein
MLRTNLPIQLSRLQTLATTIMKIKQTNQDGACGARKTMVYSTVYFPEDNCGDLILNTLYGTLTGMDGSFHLLNVMTRMSPQG